MLFEFHSVGRIVFGAGQFARLGELAAQLGRSVLVVHNGVGPAVLQRLESLLQAAGTRFAAVRQRGEPTVADVERALDAAAANSCDTLIGIGGGSAIDAAKAAAGLMGNGGRPLDYMEVVGRGQKITRPAAPWIAVPTTGGTGSEATRNAVIGAPEQHFKASIRSELLLPRIALIDPELHVDVPPEVTARCGMDALCQLIESYTSSGAGPLTDVLACHGIKLAARSLAAAWSNGRDLAARQDMAMAALLSGVTLTNAGLGAVHGFAAPLGANFPAPHGAICAALLPHVIEANVEAARRHSGGSATLARYAEIGRLVAGDAALAYEPAIAAAVDFAAGLARRLQIPPLSRCGLRQADVPAMVALAKKSSSMRYNPVALTDDALATILVRGIGDTP